MLHYQYTADLAAKYFQIKKKSNHYKNKFIKKNPGCLTPTPRTSPAFPRNHFSFICPSIFPTIFKESVDFLRNVQRKTKINSSKLSTVAWQKSDNHLWSQSQAKGG